LGGLFGLLVCGGILLALLLPAINAARGSAQRMACSNNMKQISLALMNYEAMNRHLPAACTEDPETHQKVSWRVEILPYLNRTDLYKQYDHTQPWNSPKNRLVSDTMVSEFRCHGASLPDNGTSYLMIVGDDMVGGEPGSKGVRMSDIHDGVSKTILIVEVPNSGIAWAEPRDITIDELIDRLDKGQSAHLHGFNVALCDGSIQLLPVDIDRETLRRLATANDGNPVDLHALRTR
jgi:hypothetical protein